MKSFAHTIIFIFLVYSSFGQFNEIREFETNKVKIFKSKGLEKSKGLVFLLKYPFSYDAEEHSNENIVMQFVDNKRFNLIYSIGIVKTVDTISLENQKIILSKANLKSSTNAISKESIFLYYKNNLKVANNNASYIEYISSITLESKAFIRQYFIIYKNYLLHISFSIPILPNTTMEKTKIKFQNYKPFFELVLKSLEIF